MSRNLCYRNYCESYLYENIITPSKESLGSRIDEERSEMRNVLATCKSREASNFLTQCTYKNYFCRYVSLSVDTFSLILMPFVSHYSSTHGCEIIIYVCVYTNIYVILI